ncbi:hypothetical protein [Cupriavidus sp. CuC1]|uniref:hypothetical protein n=1 Tax=Cupriavidus sp. CuC1 TaxID=3373131 RepID=UPI0037D591DD
MLKKSLLTLAFAFFLGSCGGGGDGGGSSATTQTLSVPLLTAVANLVNNGITVKFSISGSSGNTTVTGSGTLTDAPAVAATLNGVAVLKTTETVTGTVVANGNSAPLSASRIFYRNPSTFAVVVDDQGNPYIVFGNYNYPASVKAGDAAMLATGTMFSNSTQATKTGTVTLSYAVAADGANSLLVTFIDSDFDNSNNKTAEGKTTFRVDTSGNISFVSLTITGFAVNGQTPFTLVFQ